MVMPMMHFLIVAIRLHSTGVDYSKLALGVNINTLIITTNPRKSMTVVFPRQNLCPHAIFYQTSCQASNGRFLDGCKIGTRLIGEKQRRKNCSNTVSSQIVPAAPLRLGCSVMGSNASRPETLWTLDAALFEVQPAGIAKRLTGLFVRAPERGVISAAVAAIL